MTHAGRRWSARGALLQLHPLAVGPDLWLALGLRSHITLQAVCSQEREAGRFLRTRPLLPPRHSTGLRRAERGDPTPKGRLAAAGHHRTAFLMGSSAAAWRQLSATVHHCPLLWCWSPSTGTWRTLVHPWHQSKENTVWLWNVESLFQMVIQSFFFSFHFRMNVHHLNLFWCLGDPKVLWSRC